MDDLNIGSETGQAATSTAIPGAADQNTGDFSDFSSVMGKFHSDETQANQAAQPDAAEDTALQIAGEEIPNADDTAAALEDAVEPQVDKKNERVNNYKLMEERATKAETDLQTLTAERDTLNHKIEQFNATVERYGGVDKFLELEETFVGKILDPTKPQEAAQLLTQLPHGAEIRSEIMFDSIGLTRDGKVKDLPPEFMNVAVSNQAVVLNSMIKGFQGVDPNFTPDEIETLGAYLAFQVENNREGFLSELKQNVDAFVDPRDKEIRQLKAEKAANEAKSKQPPATAAEQTEQDPFEHAVKVAGEIRTFHDETAINALTQAKDDKGVTLAQKFRLAPNPQLPKEVNTANERIIEMANAWLREQMQNSNAQVGVANFLRQGAKNHPTFALQANPYKNAVSAKIKQLLTEISPRLNGTASASPAPPPPAPKPNPAGLAPDTASNIQTPTAPPSGEWGSFPSSSKFSS